MARIARLARLRLIPAAGLALALTLAGCAAGQISQTAQQVPAIDGANANIGQIAIRDIRLATADDRGYQAGADVPLKFWISNVSIDADELIDVSSPLAESVDISGAAEVYPQSLTEVGEDTDLTVTLRGLTEDVPYGHSIPVSFTFATGGTATVNVPIEVPAVRESTERPTVNVLPGHGEDIWFGGGEHAEEGAEGEHGAEGVPAETGVGEGTGTGATGEDGSSGSESVATSEEHAGEAPEGDGH